MDNEPTPAERAKADGRDREPGVKSSVFYYAKLRMLADGVPLRQGRDQAHLGCPELIWIPTAHPPSVTVVPRKTAVSL